LLILMAIDALVAIRSDSFDTSSPLSGGPNFRGA
jgi:hypothetical protein